LISWRKSNEFDDQLMEEFSYEFDGTVDGNSERSMLAYFRARALLRRGYQEWATKELAEGFDGYAVARGKIVRACG
jgi:hypothetical protein